MHPPEPVTVIVYVPVAVEDATAMVSVGETEPGAAVGVGGKETLTPLGCPDAEGAMALLKPPETVVETVDVPELPCWTDTDVGEAAIVKFGEAAAVTVKETEVVCVVPPPEPVIVIG